MRRKRNRKRGQNCGETRANMSVASTVEIAHDHSIGVGKEINLEHKERNPVQQSKAKSQSTSCCHQHQDCRPKDARVLNPNLQKGPPPILHNGCNDTDSGDHVDCSGAVIHHVRDPTPHDSTAGSGQRLLDKSNQTVDTNNTSSSNKSPHQRLDTNSSTSKNNSDDVSNEPISELTKLVENIDIQNEFVSKDSDLQQELHEASDLSGALMRGGDDDDDEMLEEFGAVGPSSVQLLENEELPSSLSDFVLGYRNDSYPIPPVPPNDDDIDVINIEGSELDINLVPYESELQMPDIMRLITKDLSEPYSIYTYRYFIHNWPQLCFLVSGSNSRLTPDHEFDSL